MRRRWTRTAAVAAAVTVAMMTGAAPVSAKGPPEVVVEDEFEFGVDVNPCTGEEHTIFVALTDRRHGFDNEAGNRHHFNLIGVFHVRTSDGFSGDVISPDTHNGTGLFDGTHVEGTEVSTVIFVGILSNPETGQRYRFRLREHLTIANGAVVVDDVAFEQECLGSGR